MTAPVASMCVDDGPEEGEIEDDDDDIIFLEGNNPHRSRTKRTTIEVHHPRPTPARKDSYERDIRHFELRKSRTARSRGPSGSSKSSHSKDDLQRDDSILRNKLKYSRTGVTQGKENRHAHRYKSPTHRIRNGSHEKALADFKDVSPLQRDSSCSSVESIDSEVRSGTVRRSRPHYRSTPKGSARLVRSKRKSSSSPESVTPSTKQKTHSSLKCPLMKVLRSVARETRLIDNTIETSENPLESSSSLMQRLQNMGVMSGVCEEPSSSKGDVETQSCEGCTRVVEIPATLPQIKPEDHLNNTVVNNVEKSHRATEVLLDGENPKPTYSTGSDVQGARKLTNQQDVPHDSTIKTSDSVQNRCVDKSGTTGVNNHSMPSENCVDDNDDEDDIRQLRLIALQSKKHETTTVDDADVLELRLAALKTAFMRKFKTRKKNTRSLNKIGKEDSLSPIDDIPLPLSPGSATEDAMTPVDMELAETDDEAASEHSMSCYSPSDPIHECFPPDPVPSFVPTIYTFPEQYSPSHPTGSPSHEPSIQELLPPPPPPDLDLYFSETNSNPENSSRNLQVDHYFQDYYLDYVPSDDILEPPPLPSYFRDLLSDVPDLSYEYPQDRTSSNTVREGNLVICSGSISESSNELEIKEVCESSFVNDREKPLSVEDEFEKDEIVSKVSEDTVCSLTNAVDHVTENKSQSTSQVDLVVSKPEVQTATESQILSLVDDNASVSLEEEEKLLRQRLLLNMANKRGIALANKNTAKNHSHVVTETLQKPHPERQISESRRIVGNALKKNYKVKMNECGSNIKSIISSSQIAKSQPLAVTLPSTEDGSRFIINLEEDSDSCEDYSEAEALGDACARNREKWRIQMKELEVNLSKSGGSGVKTAPLVGMKVPPKNIMKSEQSANKTSTFKPFAENLAALENSVEQFLKGVRNSHEDVSKSKHGSVAASSGTPVAVRHLPVSQQEEYRRLKQQIVRLERQRQLSVEQRKKSIHVTTEHKQQISLLRKHQENNISISGDQPKNSSTLLGAQRSNKSSVAKGVDTSIRNISGGSRIVTSCSAQPVALSSKLPRVLKDGVLTKSINRDSLAQSKTLNLNADSNASGTLLSSAALPTAAENPIKEIKKIVPDQRKTTALGNVSTLKVTGVLNVKKTPNSVQLVSKEAKIFEDIELKKHQSLLNLEATVIRERSNVLTELAALSKLLSQVDKSIVAQSNTATEVSNLFDKLCLASGRWKAQDKTVTSLVQQVARRQKELSLRHQSCIEASKSCVKLGSMLNGKNYRVPLDNADVMRLQLKNVHEKTQDLAKRRTAERARKNVLETRAEDCLIKLFSDSKRTNAAGLNNAKVAGLFKGSANHSTVNDAPSSNLQVFQSNVSQSSKSLQNHPPVIATPTLHENINSRPTILRNTNAVIPSSRLKLKKMVARAVSKRLALSKVRSAKAVLNLARSKRAGMGGMKEYPKRVCVNSGNNRDSKQDLSDMEISTEDEEVDGRDKDSAGNTDVMDMSVSPDTSLSPSEIEKEASETSGRLGTSDANYCFIETSIGDPLYASKELKGMPPLPENYFSSFTSEQKISTQPVLKEYVSPLGGINVFSKSTNGETKSGDPYAILCPYDLNGKCEDSECVFKHQYEHVNSK